MILVLIIILVNTAVSLIGFRAFLEDRGNFNSQFKQKYINEFEQLIVEQEGNFIDHIFVKRGRWFHQLNQDEIKSKFKEILN